METARRAAVPLRGLARPARSRTKAALARIESLAIPPAWKDVWISPRAGAKLQATGVDKAGRRQYLYHPEFRARQEQAKFDSLVLFAERLPELRKAMDKHLDQEPLSFEWTAAVAVRLINDGWFRVGDERYAKTYKTYGITTLRKGHVKVRGSRISFRFRAKHRVLCRTVLVDAELAALMKELLAAARRAAAVPLRAQRRARQPRRAAAERVHPRIPRRGVHAPRTSAPGAAPWLPRSSWPSAARRRRRPSRRRRLPR